jgi:HEAT repeat protein
MDLVPIPPPLVRRRGKLTTNDFLAISALEKRRDASGLMRLLTGDRVQESAKVRGHVVMALGHCRDKTATPTVIWLVQEDPDRDVRVIAIAALRDIGDPASAVHRGDVGGHQ